MKCIPTKCKPTFGPPCIYAFDKGTNGQTVIKEAVEISEHMWQLFCVGGFQSKISCSTNKFVMLCIPMLPTKVAQMVFNQLNVLPKFCLRSRKRQGHTDRNHENNIGSIISEIIQAMLITFAVKIDRLKIYMTIASPMTLPFIQGHKCISNLTTFKLALSRTIFKLLHSNLAWG